MAGSRRSAVLFGRRLSLQCRQPRICRNRLVRVIRDRMLERPLRSSPDIHQLLPRMTTATVIQLPASRTARHRLIVRCREKHDRGLNLNQLGSMKFGAIHARDDHAPHRRLKVGIRPRVLSFFDDSLTFNQKTHKPADGRCGRNDPHSNIASHSI
jgi:hypothetical protein